MIIRNSVKILKVTDKYGITKGNTANLNIIDVPNSQEAFRLRVDRSYVIKEGNIIAKSSSKTEILLN